MNAIEDLLDIVTDDQRVEEGQDAWGAIVVVVHGQTLAGGVAELVADLREDRLGLGRLGGALATLCRRGLLIGRLGGLEIHQTAIEIASKTRCKNEIENY